MDGPSYFREACSRDPKEYPKGANGKCRCPCCLHFTLDSCNSYDICPVCFWEDDGAIRDEDFGGPNGMTLGEGKAMYGQFGHTGEHIKQYVRKPTEAEAQPLPEEKLK